ncbi:STM4014 family protein [Lachnospiraceae bacterium 62-35]
MRRAVLLGSPDTKRTLYFRKAAQKMGLSFVFLDWSQWSPHLLPKMLLRDELFFKVDPPLWKSCSLTDLNQLIAIYQEQLDSLASLSETSSIQFLNHPDGISALLDKRDNKKTLLYAGLSVTQAMGVFQNLREPKAFPHQVQMASQASPQNAEELLSVMEKSRMLQVFIKPVTGSGAAGTAAFRWHPKTNRMALYTCALYDSASSLLVNTKRLRHFSSPDTILPLLNRILKLDCIVERWYAKAEYQGYSYDLRAVVQDGRMDFLLARLSKGPITNLHLNNHPMPADKLGLPSQVLDSIEELCLQAMACYPSLRSGGIDILLEKESLRPRIIEMNAQGDLIYQDIYYDNLIYCRQAEMILEWVRHMA